MHLMQLMQKNEREKKGFAISACNPTRADPEKGQTACLSKDCSGGVAFRILTLDLLLHPIELPFYSFRPVLDKTRVSAFPSHLILSSQ